MSFLTGPTYSDDMAYYLRYASGDVKEPARSLEFTFHRGTDGDWSSVARRAFEFLRAHSDRHYSSQTLMHALNAADWQHGGDRPEPFLLMAGNEYAFDPITEVKQGGTVGVMFQLNDGNTRALLAVQRGMRRNGVARALLYAHTNALGAPSLFVNRSNITGQQFLLGAGMFPTEMNGNGVIRFGPPAVDVE